MRRRFDPSWKRTRVALAYGLIKSDLGRQAAAEGWIIGLWDFCRATGREPDGAEIYRIWDGSLRVARELEQMAATCDAGKVALRSHQAKVEKLARVACEAEAA